MIRLLFLSVLLLGEVAHASITAAWKVPIEEFASDYKTNSKIRKLEKPPAESELFQPGDELWEVSAALAVVEAGDPFEAVASEEEKPRALREATPWGGDWAVWNARSGVLVARGSYDDIFAAQQRCGFDRQPEVVKTFIEWKRPGAERPYRSASLASQSGERALLKSEDASAEQELTLGGTRLVDARFAVTWTEAGTRGEWSVTTAVTGILGKDILLARHGSGESGWELHAKIQATDPNGAVREGSRWIETAQGGLGLWPSPDPETGEISRQPLGGDGYIAWYEIPPDISEMPPGLRPKGDLKAPASLQKWIEGPFVDCTKILRDNGVAVDTPGFFAGMNHGINQLVLAGPPAVHAVVAEILKQSRGTPESRIWIETNPESGNWGLTGRSGEKAVINFTFETKEELNFEIEPTRVPKDAIDLRLNFDFMPEQEKTGRFEGAVPALSKEWREVANAFSDKGGETKVTVRAELIAP